MIFNIPADLVLKIMDEMERTEMAIDRHTAEWLFHFIRENPSIKRTLDVGLGEGASAMVAMLATGRPHMAIDSQQFTLAGKRNLNRFNLTSKIELFTGLSSMVLPDLLRKNHKFDYTFVDAGGKIDDLFVDFHYVSRMTVQGGYILLPDNDRRTVVKFLKYLRSNRPDFTITPTPDPVRIAVLCKVSEEDARDWGSFNDF